MKNLLLWILFFLIGFGLGYPTLNRYDPQTVGGTFDSRRSYHLVVEGPQAKQSLSRYRILTPLLAKPFYWIARGRVKTWSPVWFGILMVNSFFCATTAFLLFRLGTQVMKNQSAALLGSVFYLSNFIVSNGQLSGLVDAGDTCGMTTLAWALINGRWEWLPILSILGAMNKETFVPLSLVFTAAWWLAAPPFKEGRFFPWGCLGLGGMAVAGVATLVAIQSVILQALVWPWEVMPSIEASAFWTGFLGWLLSPSFWYPFLWVLPLGIWRLKDLPRPWVLASGATALVAMVAGTHWGVEGNLGRVLFNVVGPPLSLSAALQLVSRAER